MAVFVRTVLKVKFGFPRFPFRCIKYISILILKLSEKRPHCAKWIDFSNDGKFMVMVDDSDLALVKVWNFFKDSAQVVRSDLLRLLGRSYSASEYIPRTRLARFCYLKHNSPVIECSWDPKDDR